MLILSVLGTAGCSSGVVTAYPVLCEDFAKSKQCPDPITLNRSRYRALIERQEVLEWYPGINDVPVRFVACTVRSSQNWQCSDATGQGTIRMENGKYSERWEAAAKQAEQADYVYVSAARWWMLWLGLTKGL